jgi:hypothetical protein
MLHPRLSPMIADTVLNFTTDHYVMTLTHCHLSYLSMCAANLGCNINFASRGVASKAVLVVLCSLASKILFSLLGMGKQRKRCLRESSKQTNTVERSVCHALSGDPGRRTLVDFAPRAPSLALPSQGTYAIGLHFQQGIHLRRCIYSFLMFKQLKCSELGLTIMLPRV